MTLVGDRGKATRHSPPGKGLNGRRPGLLTFPWVEWERDRSGSAAVVVSQPALDGGAAREALSGL